MDRYCVKGGLDHGLVGQAHCLHLFVLFAERSHERRVLNEMAHTLGQIEGDGSYNRNTDIPVAEDHVLRNVGRQEISPVSLARSASTVSGPYPLAAMRILLASSGMS